MNLRAIDDIPPLRPGRHPPPYLCAGGGKAHCATWALGCWWSHGAPSCSRGAFLNPKMDGLRRKAHLEMDDLLVPPFQETSIYVAGGLRC